MMSDKELAIELVERFNGLIDDPIFGPGVQIAMGKLLKHRYQGLEVKAIWDHPTIQVEDCGPDRYDYAFSFLGLLNGLVGALPDDHPTRAKWGLIALIVEDDGRVSGAILTDPQELT